MGHYLKPTGEEPPRWRVDAFPTEAELSDLQNASYNHLNHSCALVTND